MPNARLIIADDDISSELIRQNLERLGYQVLACVTSGPEVIKLADDLRPDLILLNTRLEKDHPETAEIILRHFDIPVVYLTPQVDKPTLPSLTQTSAVGCLLISSPPQQFQLTIELALQIHQRESQPKQPGMPPHQQIKANPERWNNELMLLNRASQVFISTHDLDQVLTSVLEDMRSALNVVACSAWLIDSETNEVICRQVTEPQRDTVRGWRLPIGQGLVGRVAQTGQTIIASDVQKDIRHYKGIDQQTGLNLRSILSVPLRVKDKIIGVIQIVDETVDRFDRIHQELVESLAATAAVAIENARLYEETNQLRLFNENIVNSIEEGILILDAQHRISFINPKGAQILGYQPNELINQRILTLIHPNYTDRVSLELAQYTKGNAAQYETVIITKADEQIPIIFSARPLFESGQFLGVLAVIIDISRRKKTDELLRKLSRAIEQTADHMIITNNAGIIEYVNPAFTQLTGFTGTDVIGKTPRILKSDQHQKEFYQQMWDTINAGQVFREVVINKKKNGTLFYEEQTITPIKDAEGRVTHFVSTGKDITERRLAEETLKQAIEVLRRRNRELDALNRAGRKLSSSLDLDEVLQTVLKEAQHLLGAVASSIWLIDPKTAKTKTGLGELVCRQAIGPHRETVQGWRLAPGEGIAGWVAQTGESLIVADLATDQRHFKGVDQHIGLTLRSIISVPLKRVSYGVIGVLHVLDEQVNRFNITDLVLVESLAATATVAIENAQLFAQVQQDAKTKTVLLDEINHRVKNNLSAIIGLLYAEQNRTQVNDHALYQAIIKELINRVQSLATVHSLLSDGEWAPLSLDKLAEQIIHSAIHALTLYQNVVVEISPSPVRVTPAQAHYLAMVLNELTTNAIKHGFSKITELPQITVDIRLPAERNQEIIEFEFRDNGPGFPEIILQKRQEAYNVGFDLIQNIVSRSLRGSLSLHNDQGAVAVIQFEPLTRNKLSIRKK
ncbi:MAG: GAF domain-containing protein [Anaerolineae bacterium]|nr:GAF domain-containing protein [Anaerolineae bacterium]